jgi:Double zinc ribbon
VTRCSTCGARNPATQKFCGECGTALAAICSSCGAPNPPAQKFCGEWGSSLAGDAQAAAPAAVGAQNLADALSRRELHEEAMARLTAMRALADGMPQMEEIARSECVSVHAITGDWAQAADEASGLLEGTRVAQLPALRTLVPEVFVPRGSLEEAKELLARFEEVEGSADVQDRAAYAAAKESLLRAKGKLGAALEAADDALAAIPGLGALLEHGGWLVGERGAEDAEPLLAEATEMFERLEAKPWLERTAGASGEAVAAGAPA